MVFRSQGSIVLNRQDRRTTFIGSIGQNSFQTIPEGRGRGLGMVVVNGGFWRCFVCTG